MPLILFDIDGTLTNTNEVDAECFVEAVTETLGIKNFNTNWQDYRHVTDTGILNQLSTERWGRIPSESERAKVERHFIAKLSERMESHTNRFFHEVPGASQALIALRAIPDLKIALATGGWKRTAELKLRAAGIDTTGIPMATANDSESRIEIMKTAMRISNFPIAEPENVLYVGDGVWDWNASRELGVGFLGIGTGDRAQKLLDAGAGTVLPDFSDLKTFLKHAAPN